MRTIKMALVLPAFALLFGCAGLKQQAEQALQKPEVVGQEISIRSFNFDTVNLIADLQVSNPGKLNLTVLPSDYQIYINDESLLSGTSETFRLDSDSVSTLSVPLDIRFADLIAVTDSFKGQETVMLKLDTALTLQGPLNLTWTEPLSIEKSVPVPQWPEIGIPELKVDAVGFSGFRMLIRLPVNNPNDFELNLNALSSQVNIDQLDALSIHLAEPTIIPASTETVLSIPVEMSWSKAARALLPILESGRQPDIMIQGDWELDANIPGFTAQKGQFSL